MRDSAVNGPSPFCSSSPAPWANGQSATGSHEATCGCCCCSRRRRIICSNTRSCADDTLASEVNARVLLTWLPLVKLQREPGWGTAGWTACCSLGGWFASGSEQYLQTDVAKRSLSRVEAGHSVVLLDGLSISRRSLAQSSECLSGPGFEFPGTWNLLGRRRNW